MLGKAALLIESGERRIGALAVLTRIQAQRLIGLVHAQAAAEQRLDHRGNHQVEHQHNSDRHHNAQDLRDEQNATSVASTLLTTESVVANIKEDAPAMPAGGAPGMGMM